MFGSRSEVIDGAGGSASATGRLDKPEIASRRASHRPQDEHRPEPRGSAIGISGESTRSGSHDIARMIRTSPLDRGAAPAGGAGTLHNIRWWDIWTLQNPDNCDRLNPHRSAPDAECSSARPRCPPSVRARAPRGDLERPVSITGGVCVDRGLCFDHTARMSAQFVARRVPSRHHGPTVTVSLSRVVRREH